MVPEILKLPSLVPDLILELDEFHVRIGPDTTLHLDMGLSRDIHELDQFQEQVVPDTFHVHEVLDLGESSVLITVIHDVVHKCISHVGPEAHLLRCCSIYIELPLQQELTHREIDLQDVAHEPVPQARLVSAGREPEFLTTILEFLQVPEDDEFPGKDLFEGDPLGLKLLDLSPSQFLQSLQFSELVLHPLLWVYPCLALDLDMGLSRDIHELSKLPEETLPDPFHVHEVLDGVELPVLRSIVHDIPDKRITHVGPEAHFLG